ncbi:MAG: 4Fe-4S binding protein [Candidatus Firestonebacteria bacterium]
MKLPQCLIVKPGTSRENKTGSWRSYKPNVNMEKCTACKICEMYCPEGIIKVSKETKCQIDYDYCKGCGICAQVCPQKAIAMEIEVH